MINFVINLLKIYFWIFKAIYRFHWYIYIIYNYIYNNNNSVRDVVEQNASTHRNAKVKRFVTQIKYSYRILRLIYVSQGLSILYTIHSRRYIIYNINIFIIEILCFFFFSGFRSIESTLLYRLQNVYLYINRINDK